MSDIPRGELAVYECGECGAQREVLSGDDAPQCGEMSTDMNRFPDGGWVRIEQWTVHGRMRDMGIRLSANPFEEILVANEPGGPRAT